MGIAYWIPLNTLAPGRLDTEDNPKITRASGVTMDERREFTMEVRAHIAVRPEGVSLSLRGRHAGGALQLPLRLEGVPVEPAGVTVGHVLDANGAPGPKPGTP